MPERPRRPPDRVQPPAQPPDAVTPPARLTPAERRAARRARSPQRNQRSFLDRFGGLLLAGFAVVGVLLVGLLVLSNASGRVYACDSLLTPGPSAPIPTFTPSPEPTATASGSPLTTASPEPTATPSASPSASPTATPSASPSASPTATQSASPSSSASPSTSPTPLPQPTQLVGFPVADLGRTHILDTSIHLEWDYCPPASGHHFNVTNVGPIKRDFYGADAEQNPGGWVHDLEHGYVVIAYSCAPQAAPGSSATTPPQGCPSADEMAAMRDAFDTAPQDDAAKQCGDANKLLVLRFDSMTSRFAYLAWDRVELTNTFSKDAAITFMQQWQDQANPEPNTCV